MFDVDLFKGLGGISLKKQYDVEEAAEKKKARLNVTTEPVEIAAYDDGDTFTLTDGREIRVRGIDTMENSLAHLRDKSPFAVEAQRAQTAKYLGKSIADTTDEDIVKVGMNSADIANEMFAKGNIRIRDLGKDMYGRTIADVYTDDAENVSDKLRKLVPNARADASWNQRTRTQEAADALMRAASGRPEFQEASGYDAQGKPEVQRDPVTGLFSYGSRVGLLENEIEEAVAVEDAKTGARESAWSEKDGVVNFAARIASGARKTFTDAVVKPIMGNVAYISGDSLEEMIENYNISREDYYNRGITKDHVAKFKEIQAIPYAERTEDQHAIMQTKEMGIIADHALELEEKQAAYERIDIGDEEFDKIVNRAEDTIVDQGMSKAYKEKGFTGALVYGLKNFGNMNKRIGDSLPFMAVLAASPYVSVPAMIGMMDSSVHDNTKEFVRLNNREPNKSEQNIINMWSVGEVLAEKFEAGVLSGKVPGLFQALTGMKKGLTPVTNFLSKGIDIVVGEGGSGALSELSSEMAAKQDFGKVDYQRVGIGAIQEMLAAGGMSLSLSTIRKASELSAPKSFEKKLAGYVKEIGSYEETGSTQKQYEMVGKLVELEEQAESTEEKIIVAELRNKLPEDVVASWVKDNAAGEKAGSAEFSAAPAEKTAPEQTAFTEVSDRFEKSKDAREFVTSAIADMTGESSVGRGQAVYDLIMAIGTGAVEGNEQAVANIVKEYGTEIIAASDQLSEMTKAVEENMDVTFGSLGQKGKDNTTGLKGENLVSKEELSAIEAIDTIVADQTPTELARVSREVLEDNPKTKNIGVKTYLKQTLKSGKVSPGLVKFANHMNRKLDSFKKAQELGGRYVSKGTKDYGLKTEQELIESGVKFVQKKGYKVFEGYNWIGKNSGKLIARVQTDADLVNSFLTLAKAVVKGKKSRKVVGNLASSLKTKLVKSGALDTDGKEQKEKEPRQEKKTEEKRAEEAGKPAKEQRPEPGTVAEPPKGGGAKGAKESTQKIEKENITPAKIYAAANEFSKDYKGKYKITMTDKVELDKVHFVAMVTKDGNLTVSTDIDLWNKTYDIWLNRGWGKAGMTPDVFVRHVIAHEFQHLKQPEQWEKDVLDYERRIDNAALVDIGLKANPKKAAAPVDEAPVASDEDVAAKEAGRVVDTKEEAPQLEDIPLPEENYGSEDVEVPLDVEEDFIVEPPQEEKTLGDVVGKEKYTGKTAKDVVLEILSGENGKQIAASITKAELAKDFTKEEVAEIWSARKARLSWVERVRDKFVELRGFTTGSIEKVLNHYGFAKAAVLNVLDDTFTNDELDSAIEKLSEKSDTGKRKAIVKLFESFKKSGEKYIDTNDQLHRMRYSFNNLFTQENKNSEMKIPDQVYYAMANVFASWVNSSGRKTLYNDTRDISKILYGEMDHSLTAQERRAISGIGTPLYMAASGLGREMAAILGTRVQDPSKTGEKGAKDFADFGLLSDQESFERSLGLMLLDLATHVEIDGRKIVEVNRNKNVLLGEESTARNKRTTALTKDKNGKELPEEDKRLANTIDLNTIKILNNKDPLIRLFKKSDKFFSSINGVQMGKSDIYPEGPKKSIVKRIAGSFSELPKNRQDVLEKLQNIEWRPVKKNIEIFLSLTDQQQREMAGWQSEEGVHIDKLDAVRAKNNQIDDQIQSLKDLDKEGGFWFGYYMMNQFRIMIDSNGINPLSSKNLHRFMVNPAGSETTFTRGKAEDADLETMYKYSIVQALGNEFDKTDHAGVMTDFEDTVAKYGDLAKSMDKAEISERITSAHQLAGLIALQDWVNDKEQITTNLGVEVDGITNGYALGLMQFPSDKDGLLWENLAKVGITDQKGKYEAGIDSVVDAYRTAGEAFGRALDDINLKETFEAVAGPIGRNLMKNPFMIFNYGASSYRAAQGVISSPYGVGLIEVIYKKLSELEGTERAIYITHIRALMEATAIRNSDGDIYPAGRRNIEAVITKLNSTRKNTFATESISAEMELFQNTVNAGLTGVIEQAFEPLVGSTYEIKQKLTQAMDAIAAGFAEEFEYAKAEYLGKLQFHGTKYGDKHKKAGQPIKTKLTQKEMVDVAKTLIDTHYPFLSGAWNESAKDEKLAFIDMVSKEKTDTSEQVKNGIFVGSSVSKLRKRLDSKVASLNRAINKKTTGKDLVSFLQNNGVEIPTKMWSTIAYKKDYLKKTVKGKQVVDTQKVFDEFLKDKSESLVPLESTIPLGSFGYGHPGAKMIVRSVQNADASIMGKTIMDTEDGFLGLHDAIYMSIANIQAGVEKINQNALETMRDYSIAEAVEEQFKKVYENIKMTDRRLSDRVGNPMLLEQLRFSLAEINRLTGQIAANNTRIEKHKSTYESESRINRIAKSKKGTPDSVLKRQEQSLLELDTKINRLEDGIVKYYGDINALEKTIAKTLSMSVPKSKEFLESLDKPVDEKTQKTNLERWDQAYSETAKEWKDYNKNSELNPLPDDPSEKLKPLAEIVADNKADRARLFETLENGEVVQYYMPGGKPVADQTFSSLGSSKQDIAQDTMTDEFIGSSSAADIKRINKRLGGNNSNPDINRVVEALIAPLMEKIDDLTISIRKSDKGFAEGLYTAGTNTIEMVYNYKGPESRTEQTEQEVFGHEMIHAVAWRAVQNSQKFRTELGRLRDSIKGKVSVSDFIIDKNPSEHAKKMAELQYRAVFGTGTSGTQGLHEFLAYGLTNPVLVKKLKGLSAKRGGWFEGNNWYEKLVSAMVKAIEVIEYMINKQNDQNAFEQLLRMTQQVNGINQSKVSKLASKFSTEGFYQSSDNFMRTFVEKNSEYAKGVIAILAKKNAVLFKKVESKLPDFDSKNFFSVIGSTGKTSVGVIRHMSAILAMATDKNILTQADREQWMLNVMEASTDWVNERETKIARTLLNAVSGIVRRTPIEIQRLISRSQNEVEGARKADKEMVENLVKDIFERSGRQPTEAESRMLTKVVGKADLQALLDVMDPKDIVDLIVNENKLDLLINNEAKVLRNEGMDIWWWKQAQGLSNRMVNQDAKFGVVFDNVYVANVHAPKSLSDLDRFNRYVSLLALKKTTGRGDLSSLVKDNRGGVESLLEVFKTLDVRSRREAFNNNRFLMTKGYVARIADPHKKIEVAEADQKSIDNMKLRGFELQYKLPNGTDALFLANNLPVDSQTKGLMSKTAKHRAHTSILEIFKSKWVDDPNIDRAENYKKMMEASSQYIKRTIVSQRTAKDGALRPIVNEVGKIVDFTIDMNFNEEERLLGLNMDVGQVASTIQSRITDKSNTETINREGIKVLIKRSKDHYKNNPWEFVNLMDVNSDIYNKHFARLPYEARKEIEAYAETHNGTFFVEEVWLDQIFGHENWTIGNLIKDERMKRKARVVEEVVKEIVGIINNNIVIKTPAVWAGNFASNFVTSLVSGLGVLETIKYWKEGLSELRKYQADADALNRLDFQAEANIAYKKANAARRQKLVDRMNSNPTKELVDAGLYNAITTEAVGANEYNYKNKAVRFYEDKTKGVPGAERITSLAKGIYMAEDTSAYKSLLGMVQVSDFLGRYGIYKKMTLEQGKTKDEAYSYIQDMFVDFNLPTSAALQYANSMGMVMFYKYWSRIQRATLGMIKHHPTKSMQTLLMRSMLGMDIATIFNSGIITGGNFSPMSAWTRPGEMLREFVIPSGVEIGLNFSDGIIGFAGAAGTGAALYDAARKDNEVFGFHFGSSGTTGAKTP